ncbi:hypothetical protein [Telmatospirillum sp. J64-1]|uniref:hypothetical protein n=1 Tax=Telmatospirillum sp. J64-1 TaxID=2502183 RepID=UPI00115F6BB5|nr:hypothetical protein [Telmatospirillum sp. J64-1]
MMNNQKEAVLLLTHFLDDHIIQLYRRMEAEAGARDVFILFNKSDDNNPGYPAPWDARIFAFEEDDLHDLGYPIKGLHIRDVDIELFHFTFQRRHPEYDTIWTVEYDVDFTGRWGDFFDAFATNDADLLGTSMHRLEVNPFWANWSSIRAPDGTPPPSETLIRAFLPLCRLSRRAYDRLDAFYREGWHGHYECTVPTLLTRAGLRIEDIGGNGEFVAPGNRNRYYTSNPATRDLSPGSFVFRPIMTAPGNRMNTLWHPVKPPMTDYVHGWDTGRLAMLKRRMRALSRRGVARMGRWMRRSPPIPPTSMGGPT